MSQAAVAPRRDDALDAAFRGERGTLFRTAYRMTGSVAEAEDVVQETFTRALERPPADATRPWGPWLMQVAMNLSRDKLRARKRRKYAGVWLPAALELTDDPRERRHGEAIYGEIESVTVAFLLAIEALTPSQRAVLILRDVLDYTVEETARVLELTETNVKVTHHRARKRMEAYDTSRVPLDDELVAKSGARLAEFMMALLVNDIPTMERLLAADARTITDGGGVFHSAMRVVKGRENVIKFNMGVLRKSAPGPYRVANINGLPGVVLIRISDDPKIARNIVVSISLNREGLIAAMTSVLAPEKVAHIDFPTE